MVELTYGEEIEGEKSSSILLYYHLNGSFIKNALFQRLLKFLLKVDFRKIKNTSKYANGYKH